MIKEEYVFMLYTLFIVHVSRIIYNTNILTDGRWRYYDEMSQRICHSYSKLQTSQKQVLINTMSYETILFRFRNVTLIFFR